ncbi:hypothetical protein V6N11_008643 [Hibiscus sabdariffa]|uniref:Uncharacterized protein n=1 Tax=Hibiscus sabdariffa TaxID=183260 RepID=A0ABR2PNW6_9ROSI
MNMSPAISDNQQTCSVGIPEAHQGASRVNVEEAGDLGAKSQSLDPSEGYSSSHEVRDFISTDRTLGTTLNDATTGAEWS